MVDLGYGRNVGITLEEISTGKVGRSWEKSVMGELGHIMRGRLNGKRLGKAMRDLEYGRNVGINLGDFNWKSWEDRGRNQLWEKCGHGMGGDLNRKSWGDRGRYQRRENLDI